MREGEYTRKKKSKQQRNNASLTKVLNLRLPILTYKRVCFILSEGVLHIPLVQVRGNIFETTMVVVQRTVGGKEQNE